MTVLVKINFYGVYRDFLDRQGLELDLPQEITLRGLLHELSDVLGPKFRERILEENGALHRHVTLSVNNQQVNPSEIDQRLNPDDSPRSDVSVLFVPPLMGGI